jgi:glucoamylase
VKINVMLSLVAAAAASLTMGLAHATTAGEAFGSPGAAAVHGPAQKSFLGTAVGASASSVYFTG